MKRFQIKPLACSFVDVEVDIKETKINKEGKRVPVGNTFTVVGKFGRTSAEVREYLTSLNYFVVSRIKFCDPADCTGSTKIEMEGSLHVVDFDNCDIRCNCNEGHYTGRPSRFHCATVV